MTCLYTPTGVTSRDPSTNQKPGRSQSYPCFVFARQKYSPLIGPTVSAQRAPIGSPESKSDKLRCVSDRFWHIFVPRAASPGAKTKMRPEVGFAIYAENAACTPQRSSVALPLAQQFEPGCVYARLAPDALAASSGRARAAVVSTAAGPLIGTTRPLLLFSRACLNLSKTCLKVSCFLLVEQLARPASYWARAQTLLGSKKCSVGRLIGQYLVIESRESNTCNLVAYQ